MVVPFLDLRVVDPADRRRYLEAIDVVLSHGRIVIGPEVAAFEEAVAAYCGVAYAVGVASGSAALFMALKSLGIGPGDEVITTALSFVGTANGIAMTGATPVFTDIQPDLTIDSVCVERAITPRTKAIMPVHFTGKLCAMPELAAVAERHNLPIVEDAAPAIGASYRGRKAGAFGLVNCISLNPMKILNALGEAGVVLTNDAAIRDRLLALRHNGLVNGEYCHYVSGNGRIDTIQAAILLRRIERLEDIIERRRQIAAYYQAALGDRVDVPHDSDGYRDVYYTFTVAHDRRDALAAFLAKRGIEIKIQHPALMPEHPAYRMADLSGFPVGRRAVKRLLCLPAHEKLTQEQVEYVAASVHAFFDGVS